MVVLHSCSSVPIDLSQREIAVRLLVLFECLIHLAMTLPMDESKFYNPKILRKFTPQQEEQTIHLSLVRMSIGT